MGKDSQFAPQLLKAESNTILVAIKMDCGRMFSDSKPILFFSELQKPGEVSLFTTLIDIKELVAKNKKPYLRLVVADPTGKELSIQIWSDTELYAPKELFMKKYLLKLNGPIHLIKLSFDGEFVGSSMKTKIDAIPTQHPIYEKYIVLSNYRIRKTIPKNSKVLKEIGRLISTKPLVEAIVTRLEEDNVTISEGLLVEITKLVVDKTYTGTIHLIKDEPQIGLTKSYIKYVVHQLEMLMIAFEETICTEPIAPVMLIRRLSKDLVSLFEFTKKTKRSTSV